MIELVPYGPASQPLLNSKVELRRALGNIALRIDHIGARSSSGAPQLSAERMQLPGLSGRLARGDFSVNGRR
jgi:hypothetical protein